MTNGLTSSAPGEFLIWPPPAILPQVRKISRVAQTLGFADAVVETLNDANIHFETEGDTQGLTQEHGVLIASDHRQRIEPWLVQGLMSMAGRAASHIIGMPSSLQCRLIHSVGDSTKGLILPVIPGIYATERRDEEISKYSLKARRRHSSLVRPQHEIDAINSASIHHAANIITAGSAVTIYPTGVTKDATDTPWRKGVGEIIRNLPVEARDNTQVVILRADQISMAALAAALSLRQVGIRLRAQSIVLHVATLGTPQELFREDLSAKDPAAAQRITDAIRGRYLQRFTGHIL